jgi:hypothetical protein
MKMKKTASLVAVGVRAGRMTNVRRLVAGFAAIFLLCLGALPSAAQNESLEAAERVPAGIHAVMSGGYWTRDKEEGFFRAIVTAAGVEHVSHRLFIQWLRINAKDQSYELVRTVNVTELNLGHGHVLEVKTAFGDVNSFKIDVTANTRGGKAQRFAITAKGDGKYTIQSR